MSVLSPYIWSSPGPSCMRSIISPQRDSSMMIQFPLVSKSSVSDNSLLNACKSLTKGCTSRACSGHPIIIKCFTLCDFSSCCVASQIYFIFPFEAGRIRCPPQQVFYLEHTQLSHWISLVWVKVFGIWLVHCPNLYSLLKEPAVCGLWWVWSAPFHSDICWNVCTPRPCKTLFFYLCVMTFSTSEGSRAVCNRFPAVSVFLE